MAGTDRKKSDPLAWLDEISDEESERLYQLDFFRLVRLLESSHPEVPRVGTARLPQDEIVRFSQKAFLDFATSTLSDFSFDRERNLCRLGVRFAGFFGPFGALPQVFTEFVVNRRHRRSLSSTTASRDGVDKAGGPRPKAGRPWELRSGDFSDLPGFVRQLRDSERHPATRALGLTMLKSLPNDISAKINNGSTSSFLIEPLCSTLLGAINQILQTVWLADAVAEDKLALTSEIRSLVEARPQGDSLGDLNRELFDLAFAGRVKTRESGSKSDETIEHFLDLFHHRMLALFYRAWAVNNKAVDADRADNSALGESQRYPVYFGSLIGIGQRSLRGQDKVPDYARLYYSGLLASQSRNASSLCGLLHDFFGIPAQVQPFVGSWVTLPVGDRCRLGHSRATGLLGSTVILGEAIWDCQMTFRIRMGPMGLTDFMRMLPLGEAFARLRCWVRSYVGDELAWDLQLELNADAVPKVQLGKNAYLGWTSWLITAQPKESVADLVVPGSVPVLETYA
jgi:type VI secretion system ImpH/TssG family protein